MIPVKIGPEFLVNTETASDQVNPTITGLTGGGFVITWTDTSGTLGDSSGSSIKAQVYGADGAQMGTEFLVATETFGNQQDQKVTGLSNGNFVVTWGDFSGTLGDSDNGSIKAQVFTASGAMVGSEFLVNTVTAGNQLSPTITDLAGGGFVVTWNDYSGTLGDSDGSIHAQVFGANGAKVGTEFLVNTQTGFLQYEPAITGLTNGGFVVTWTDFSHTLGDESNNSIKAQVFGASGNKVGTEFPVNTNAPQGQFRPTTTGLTNGGFVVTWYDYSGTLGDSDGTSIKAQMFGADGTKVGTEFLVNTQTVDDQWEPTIAGLAGGGFVITWNDFSTDPANGDGSGTTMKAQVFGADGAKQGTEFIVNTQADGDQYVPMIAGLAGGDFVITWNDYSANTGDGSSTSIKAQIFSLGTPNTAPVITSDGGGEAASRSIAENTRVVTAVQATDIDAGTTLTYAITGGADAALFQINAATGALSFIAAPNFEAPKDAGADNVYNVIVSASDGKLSDTQAIAVTVTNINEAPVITSNGGGAKATISIAENAKAVTTVKAADPDAGTTLTYAISGGADAALFTINTATGALAFKAAPNFEVRADKGTNNVYDVIVRASDGALTDTQSIAVTVTNANEAPVITSNGGGAAAAVSVAENVAAVTTVRASDPDAGTTLTYAITGGADAALFKIDAATGALSFKTAPDFEAPADVGGNNVYNVIVHASDGTLADTQAIAVTVTDVPIDPVKVGPEFLVNSQILGDQDGSKITGLVGGGFVVTWRDANRSQGDVRAQVFGANGNRLGFEFVVNTQGADTQYQPAITGLANGGFVVTWQDSSGTLGDSGTSIKAQVFGATGAKVGSEFLVNTQTANDQFSPTITDLASGGFVITWSDNSGTLGDSSTSIKAQVFSAGGAKVGTEFLVNTQTANGQSYSKITGLANGGFVVTWQDGSGTLGDSSDTSIKAQVFTAGGAKRGTEFLVNTVTANSQAFPTITDLANGGFVITWQDFATTSSLKAQVFGADGTKVGSEVQVNTQTANGRFAPTITSLATGGFVVTWMDGSGTLGDNSGTSIKAQVFGADGSKVGSEFLVNTQTTSDQEFPTITGLANGDFVVTWTDTSSALGDGMGTSVKAQVFSPGDPGGAPEITSNGGGAAAAVSVAENVAAVTTVRASDPDAGTTLTYAITGGADAALFKIDAATGALAFKTAPDFDAPADIGGNNVYHVIVRASDGTFADTQAIAVTVTDVSIEAVKVGPEFLVNTQTASEQALPQVASLSSGGFVVTWQDLSGTLGNSSSGSIKAQLYGANGGKVGAEFLVNTQTASNQVTPTITGLANGGFVVTWQDLSGTLGDSGNTGIKAQVFGANGAKVGTEFLVNTQTALDQTRPSITSLSNGGFVVTWEGTTSVSGALRDTSINAQVFGADGSKVGTEFLVNTQAASNQLSPTVTGLANGGFVVTWFDTSGTLGDSSGSSIKAQMYGANSAKVGSEFLVNTQTASTQASPTITGLANGGFVITWQDLSGTLGDSGNTSIKAQIFGATGAKVGTEFLVNTQTANDQGTPQITDLADGGFVVTWFDTSGTLGDGSSSSIKAQVFSANGTKMGSEFLVNTQTASVQQSPTITGLANGDFVVAWSDFSGTLGDSSAFGIKAQVFSLGDPGGAPDVTGTVRIDSLIGTVRGEKLLGLAGNDRLTALGGDDLLDGGTGNDVMLGGAGNDTYIVDATGDRTVELAGEGTDTVQTALATYTLAANVENLTFIGKSAHRGNGNALANTIIGGGGNDRLDGRGGEDLLQGGAGNDLYYLDVSTDRVIEAAGGGIDTVIISFSATAALADNVENLTLTGVGALDGIGNALNNTLAGNSGDNTLLGAAGDDRLGGGSGNDRLDGGLDKDVLSGGNGNDALYGGLGRDVLAGGAGADRFVFDTAPNSTLNSDTISDFVSKTDTLVFSRADFGGFASTGVLAAGAFRSGDGINSSQDGDDRLIYNSANGYVWYDADGNGSASKAVLVAILTGHPGLALADVLIVA